ncbi:Zinc transporter [Apophysomyces sp. BC1034]|nr:Zinc transporter [Apophysomyces sp. BC1015]KAG0187967.1 Zinc transporter [Apophysomyces sp. BC1034]
MALAAGVLLFSSFALLLPESQKRLTSEGLVYLSFFGGALFTLLLSRIIHKFTPGAIHTCNASSTSIECCDEDHPQNARAETPLMHNVNNGKRQQPATGHSQHHHHQHEARYGAVPLSESHFQFHPQEHQPHDQGETFTDTISGWDNSQYARVGIQTAIAICVHKFPEGLVLFISNQASTSLGLSVSIAISIHNLTEGFMIALPLYYATRSRVAAFVYAAVLGGLSQPLGALLGLLAIRNVDKAQEDELFGITFGIISGMMSLITIQSLLPQAIKADSRHEYVLGFFFLGVFLVGLTSVLQEV